MSIEMFLCLSLRLRLNKSKSAIPEKLAETTHLTSLSSAACPCPCVRVLRVRPRSLGSLSACSKGSLNSTSLTDLYTYSETYPDIKLGELHRYVEKVLQGHTIGTIRG